MNTDWNDNDCMVLLIILPNCDAIGKFSANGTTRV